MFIQYNIHLQETFMKKFILSFIAINILTSSLVFAYEASPGTIVSEPRIENHGFKDFWVESLPSSNSKKNFSVNALAQTTDQSGRIKENIRVTGWHNVAIYNNSKVQQKYTYTYQLDCENANSKYSRDVYLSPGSSFSDSANTFTTVQKQYPGAYGIKAATFITGPESVGHDARATLRVSN
jgi:hypothetical protein